MDTLAHETMMLLTANDPLQVSAIARHDEWNTPELGHSDPHLDKQEANEILFQEEKRYIFATF